MISVIDFECSVKDGKQFVKELTCSCKCGRFHTAIFRSPCEWNSLTIDDQNRNDWLFNNRSRIKWNICTTFENVEDFIERVAGPIIIVRGENKAQLLQTYSSTKTIINCQSFTEEFIPSRRYQCRIHRKKIGAFYCSLSKCRQLFNQIFSN